MAWEYSPPLRWRVFPVMRNHCGLDASRARQTCDRVLGCTVTLLACRGQARSAMPHNHTGTRPPISRTNRAMLRT